MIESNETERNHFTDFNFSPSIAAQEKRREEIETEKGD